MTERRLNQSGPAKTASSGKALGLRSDGIRTEGPGSRRGGCAWCLRAGVLEKRKLPRSLYTLDKRCSDCHGPWISFQSSEKVSFDHFAGTRVAFTEERISRFLEVLTLPGQRCPSGWWCVLGITPGPA